MGYYTGNGITTNGGSSVSLLATGPGIGGAYYVFNRTQSSVNTKNGVSLAACQNERGDMNLNYMQWPGGAVTPACRGTRKSVSFSQIGGSNLYSLQVTDETIQVRAKEGTYDSGWVN